MDRKPTEDGGVLRGYQLTDRLFVRNTKKAKSVRVRPSRVTALDG